MRFPRNRLVRLSVDTGKIDIQITRAEDFLGSSLPEDSRKIAKVALLFLEKDLEKDFVKLEKDFEKDCVKLEKDFEKDLVKLEKDFVKLEKDFAQQLNYTITIARSELNSTITIAQMKLECVEAYFLSELSASSQRAVVERFFWELISLWKDNSTAVHKAIQKKSKDSVVRAFIAQANSEYPKMMPVDRMLTMVPDIQAAVWNTYNFSPTCPFPSFADPFLMYGTLSDRVHSGPRMGIIVPSNLPSTEKCFFSYLGNLFNKKLIEFDVMKAAKGEMLVK